MFEEKYKTIGLNIMYYRRALSLTQSELRRRPKCQERAFQILNAARDRLIWSLYFAGAGFGG